MCVRCSHCPVAIAPGTTGLTSLNRRSLQTAQGLYSCWIWPGYPALNLGYKTMVKMVVFAQIFVKQWSGVLKQRGWLEMTSIYLTLVWFEGLFKDPDSRNNGMVKAKANITELQNLVILNGTLAKNWILDLLIFSSAQVPQYHDL